MPETVKLHPAFTPETNPPVRFARLAAREYRRVFSQCAEISTIDGARAWQADQVYRIDEKNGHRMFVRLALLDGEHALLNAEACVQLADALLTFAVALANVNEGEAETVSTSLIQTLQKLLDPCTFARFSEAVARHAERELFDRILTHAAEQGTR